jgi:hypothetical protein
VDIKKLAAGIVILGILITIGASIAYLTAGGKAPGRNDPFAFIQMNDYIIERDGIRQSILPYLLIGIGIVAVGVIVGISAQKNKP